MKVLYYVALSLICLLKFTKSEDQVLYSEQESVMNTNIKSAMSAIENVVPVGEMSTLEQESISDAAISDNTTISAPSVISTNETKKMVACKLWNSTQEDKHEVEIVNSTRLLETLTPDNEVTSKETEARCTVVMFYSRLCPFSAMAAPHFNALARSFPDIKLMALDAQTHHGFNTQYGIVGVPTIIIFHNGRPVAKFNGTEYTIHSFVTFISGLTGIKEELNVVHSQDFQGPVPSTVDKDIDYFLVLSWFFITTSMVFFFSKSFLWKIIIEKVKNIWREAEAQHAHID